ncbi:hypothetical protein MRX96_058358 [Rhipicephalus microplus]
MRKKICGCRAYRDFEPCSRLFGSPSRPGQDRVVNRPPAFGAVLSMLSGRAHASHTRAAGGRLLAETHGRSVTLFLARSPNVARPCYLLCSNGCHNGLPVDP